MSDECANGERAQGVGLVALLIFTSLLTMLNSASFPALVPVLQREWGLSNTEAGIISGIFYGGYICAVPVTVSMTEDRKSTRLNSSHSQQSRMPSSA